VLPLALGAAVSPLLLVAQVLTLTSPGSGLRRGWFFALGSTLVVAVWVVLGLAKRWAISSTQRFMFWLPCPWRSPGTPPQ
jgi:threonine/homoserine/homoserine lactone efflux protein